MTLNVIVKYYECLLPVRYQIVQFDIYTPYWHRFLLR